MFQEAQFRRGGCPQGRNLQGAHFPRGTFSKGHTFQGSYLPRGTFSKVHSYQWAHFPRGAISQCLLYQGTQFSRVSLSFSLSSTSSFFRPPSYFRLPSLPPQPATKIVSVRGIPQAGIELELQETTFRLNQISIIWSHNLFISVLSPDHNPRCDVP